MQVHKFGKPRSSGRITLDDKTAVLFDGSSGAVDASAHFKEADNRHDVGGFR
jgi:hypothetical protein